MTQVRVRVGPTTGPMQIVVEEALRQDNPGDPGHPTYACCKAINASPVFTPAANAITPVNVNFPVKQDLAPEPSGYYVDDHLSLSVLAPNVPIPASTDPNASYGVWLPAWQVGEERAGGASGGSGATVLFNADWNQSGGAVQGPIGLARKTAPVRNGNALLDLICNLGVPCQGGVQLQNQNAGLARIAAEDRGFGALDRKKPKTYAKGKFTIPAGKRKTVKLPLRGAGKRLLRKHGASKVWANFTLKGQAAGTLPSAPVKLKP